MTPDYEAAAIKATETLIKFGVFSAPVDVFPMLKKMGVLLLSFQNVSNTVGMSRKCVIETFGKENQDAFTSINFKDGKKQYIVTYNQLLSTNLCQRALARELGHIVMGHDGTKPEEVRNEEAKCFANHLLCPRPLVHLLQCTGMRITAEMIGSITGCYDLCLSCIRKLKEVHVPPDLNRKVRDQFMPYVMNYFNYQTFASLQDGSASVDFGTYMDGYEE